MTAPRRTKLTMYRLAVTGLSLAFAFPAAAQNSDSPVDVTAAPPPSAETVGPSQLRNFSLNGTVTRPADQPAASAPAPAAAVTPEQRQVVQNRPSASSTAVRAPAGEAPPMTRPTLAGSGPILPPIAPATPDISSPDAAAVTQPPVDVAATPVADPLSAARGGGLPWEWILALVAAVAGGFYLLRGRRARRERYGDFGRLAFAGPQPDQAPDWPRKSPTPAPPVPPRNHPIPPRPVADVPVPPPAKPVADGLITSVRLKPELNVQFTPDRAVVTEQEVMIQFDMVIVNSGSAPARDVLVEARLVCAHAGQDAEIATFFQQPAGPGDRMAAIQPLNRISLKSAVRLPLDQLHSFEVDGRRLFVPLIAFNVHFRSGAGEGQASASFLVGRGRDDDEKLAPFRLDLGPRIFRGLSARPHSMGLSR